MHYVKRQPQLTYAFLNFFRSMFCSRNDLNQFHFLIKSKKLGGHNPGAFLCEIFALSIFMQGRSQKQTFVFGKTKP